MKCDEHQGLHHHDTYSCLPPFELFNCPSDKKQKETRQQWIRPINLAEENNSIKLLEPTKSDSVCFVHFVGHPSESHPFPELNLGYVPKRKSEQTILQ